MKANSNVRLKTGFGFVACAFLIAGCGGDSTSPTASGNAPGQGFAMVEDLRDAAVAPENGPGGVSNDTETPVFIVIDEESVDNGGEPNDFSDIDVNDNRADLGQRDQLRYFRDNVGRTIELNTGEVGDEGWFALREIPNSWINTGPTGNGAQNFAIAGPRLGAPYPDDDREVLLDKIPNVTPLRATGLTMLIGQTVFAVVYDSDVSINYSPLLGSLKGENLGVVALRVVDVRERVDGSTGSLPRVTVEIVDATTIDRSDLYLFSNAPVPESSSEPYDTRPPVSVRIPEFERAR